MRALLLVFAALLLQGAPQTQADPDATADPGYFRYTRAVTPASAAAGQSAACALLDAAVFEHASTTLADLRLYASAGTVTLPYVLTTSQSTLLPPDPARVLNLGSQTGHIVFDVAMPPRSYTELDLNLAGSGFLAVAHVSGLHAAPGPHPDPYPVKLGTATLFDLTGQNLSRSTVIPLQEASFPFLHVALDVHAAPGSSFVPTPAMVVGAQVPPSRDAQTLYTTVLQTSTFAQRGRQTIATLDLPPHLPVERVTFLLAPGDHTSFSRTVHLTALTQGQPTATATAEHVDGEVSRVQMRGLGFAPDGTGNIDQQSLSLPATLAANLNAPAHLEITVDNGDDKPVAFAGVRLEMRERKLCFAGSPQPLTLMYGDPVLPAPTYDFARLFNPAIPAAVATLGPEQRNAAYHPRPERARSFTDRHPELLWLALLAAVGVLALVAFRSGRQ